MTALDVSGHTHLEHLPVGDLAAMTSLTSLACDASVAARIISTLLETPEGVDDFVLLIKKDVCKTIFSEGKLDLSIGSSLMKESDAGIIQKILDQINTPMFIKALAQLDGTMTAFDVSGHTHLARLPVGELAVMASLTSLECKDCPRLFCPPPEIAEQDGKAVVRYLQDVQANGVFNREIELIMIGKGESGKTSVVNALKEGKSGKIHEDNRTVGISLQQVRFEQTEADGLVFQVKDLAGQAVYTLTNQYFLVRRAIFALVWRVLAPQAGSQVQVEQQVSEMVSIWLDSMQLRVPGATVVLVATHIDCATEAEVKKQCQWVQALVAKKLQRFKEEEQATGIPALNVWDEGNSLCVNCLEGTGMSALEATLIQVAHALPWWCEGVPESYKLLENRISELSRGQPWLSWPAYAQAAAECGVEGVDLRIATKFLHDKAVLKFFGDLKHIQETSASADVDKGMLSSNDVVYIKSEWIIDVLKGLIRHSRDTLLEFFNSPEINLTNAVRSTWLRRIQRLAAYGRLHKELVPFLWPDGLASPKSLISTHDQVYSCSESHCCWCRLVGLEKKATTPGPPYCARLLRVEHPGPRSIPLLGRVPQCKGSTQVR